MSKIRCVISAPVDTYSGYGGRSRDFVKELLRVKPDWDISIMSQRWGNCRIGYLGDHEEYELMGHLIDTLTFKPEVWIQITVPNEFKPVGMYNIGVTAAMETTLCDSSWVLGCNNMNLVIVSSEHGKLSLTNSTFNDNRNGSMLEVKTPIEVLFEGLDQDKYYSLGKDFKSDLLKGITSDWNYLCIGHWMQGDYGQDRKNIGYTVKMFLETFKDFNGKAPGLILKTTQVSSSIPDRYNILNKLYAIRESVQYKKSLPKVYLLHGELTDEEINELYNDYRVKALVSFTKGEGFGRPLLEFAAIGKPVLCSGWSGHLDFLDKEYTAMVGGTVEKVDPSAVVANMIIPEAAWFKPDDKYAYAGYMELYNQKTRKVWSERATKQAARINTEFTKEKMGDKLKELLDKHIPEFTERLPLNLPKELTQIVQ